MENIFTIITVIGIIVLIMILIIKLGVKLDNAFVIRVGSKNNFDKKVDTEIPKELSDNDKLINAIDRNTKAIEENTEAKGTNTFFLCVCMILIAIGVCYFTIKYPELRLQNYFK